LKLSGLHAAQSRGVFFMKQTKQGVDHVENCSGFCYLCCGRAVCADESGR
jgi:hypothetical protein